ncbi:hypothetical protein M422DRAFT_276898 [Sphaerobolus stellatus SS14]|uniref:Uncharacterized protein n=1 Tax=Sphaerobolus stellatus (strain SS14) TaxID=990650 RepID=A0A0C9TL94_SPHS4|nr:hypothetical protein M422DRAFT_276898 [Sphaerobolus stellatus SS14]
MKTTESSTKETEFFPNRRPYCNEDLLGRNSDNPDGKWPEKQHGKFYEYRLPTISVTKSVLCDPSNGYMQGAFNAKRPYLDFWLRTNVRAF